MRIEIVHNQGNALGIGIMLVNQITHSVCPIDFRPTVSDLDEPLSG